MIRSLQDGLKEIVSAVLVLAGVIFFILFFLVVTGSAAEARTHHHYRHHYIHYDGNGNDPRPRAWCGWWMRHYLGVADRAYNLAANWRHYGSAALGPAIGVLVVWSHHIGVITGHTSTGWVVKSGNDAHAVRERERPLRGVIAYRMPSRMAGL